MKILGREPAALLYALQAVLAVAVSFGAFGLTATSAGWVMTIANGVMALVVAIVTHPLAVSAAVGAVQTILTGAISFGLPLTEAQTGTLIAALSVVLGLALRTNLAPRETALTRA
jgi:hypothetical protein